MSGAYKEAVTIEYAMEKIRASKYLLPAIQRNFVWECEQICTLFDSLMRGYPIGTFMFWRVCRSDVVNRIKFYEFVDKYQERFNEHGKECSLCNNDVFHAVIDGQQRLTSLYIALRGSYAYRLPRLHWQDTFNESYMPTRVLCVNLDEVFTQQGCNDDGSLNPMYHFEFVPIKELNEKNGNWFKVGDILNLRKNISGASKIKNEVSRYMNLKKIEGKKAKEILSRLYKVIVVDKIINYYEEKSENIDEVLDIFTRSNSGGTPLTFSDILMSVTSANWTSDVKEKFRNLITAVRNKGFYIGENLILKICLAVEKRDVVFKLKNFGKKTVQNIERNWDDIQSRILDVFSLLKALGYNDYSLRSKNAVIPIVFYLFHHNIKDILTSTRLEKQRKSINKWLAMSLLKKVFGGQSDNVINAIVQIIVKSDSRGDFPLTEIAEHFKGNVSKNLNFDDDTIDNLLRIKKESSDCFAVLALLQNGLDMEFIYNIDHLHPSSCFDKKNLKKEAFWDDLPDAKKEIFLNPDNWNTIPNLSLLQENKNKSKNATPLNEWIEQDENRCHLIFMPKKFDYSLENFPKFILKRKELLKKEIKKRIQL